MRFIARMVAALSIGLLALGVSAAPDNPQNGVDYRTLNRAQPTEPGARVEVIEFFWYSCPHCNSLEPALNDWVKKQGDNIVFKRVPVAFRDSMVPQQKLYYALEAMGKLDELHHKIFNAIHVQRQALDSDAAIINFMVKQGFNEKGFKDVFDSFGVKSKVLRAAQMRESYQVDGVPLLAVDGRFLTSPSIVSASIGNRPDPVLHAATMQVLDWLVAGSAKDKRAAVPAAAPAKPAAAAKPKSAAAGG